MEEMELRGLETRYRLRVRTGCETCRIRKVKCDETKPSCLRCTKTGRTCDGYNNVVKPKKTGYAAAALYRNSGFLVVPQELLQSTISRGLPRNLSQNPMENRSFEYFKLHTLPMWTEFFASELWSRTVLQLSHTEPAIKHGILALSTMHERYESVAPVSTPNANDFAFIQYMQAVKHSNALLRAHQEGKVSLEMVLIACIIFICYENLAGNYQAAVMHLKNGMRILEQSTPTACQSVVAHVLYRFDLQAMTFSDNTSKYDYVIEQAPTCPFIPGRYDTNGPARDDLVGVLRCMMWSVGVIEQTPSTAEHPVWHRLHRKITLRLTRWEQVFETYRQNLSLDAQRDPKIYAGNTLLRISALTIRIIMGAGAGLKSEMCWDPFIDSFKSIVDLAETIPLSRPTSSRASHTSASSSTSNTPRPILPNPSTSYLSTTSPHSSFVFSYNSTPPTPDPSKPQPGSFFSPSFELSPIVPLFIVACRCRDPTTRRRAIALLLSYRRREGVWDSLAAGMVATRCMRIEEGLVDTQDLGFSDAAFLLRRSNVEKASDVPEGSRVKYIFVAVKMVKGRVDLVYSMTTGEMHSERQVLFESRGDRG